MSVLSIAKLSVAILASSVILSLCSPMPQPAMAATVQEVSVTKHKLKPGRHYKHQDIKKSKNIDVSKLKAKQKLKKGKNHDGKTNKARSK